MIKKNAEWYKKNREHALEMKRRKTVCDICGKEVTQNYLKKHQKNSNCIHYSALKIKK